ncbi:MAG: putative Ig domain-containing protein [Candidatus Marinamargulisbacteria bacterium]
MDTAMKDTYFNDYESSEFTEVNKAALERFNKDDILQLRADIGGVEVSDTIKDKINAEGYKTELYTRDEIALLKAAMSRHSKETIRNLGEKVAEINQYVFNHFKYEGKQSNLKDLPKWMDFQAPNIKEKRSGKLSGTPSDQDVGDQQRWQLQIIGYDGFGGKGTQQVTLAKNTRPILVNPLVSPEVLLAGQTLNYVIPNNAFSDNDGDALSYSATYNGGALPSWLTFDKNTRVLSGASNVGGQWVIDITANDGKGGVVSGQITVQVAQSNIAPIIINSLVNPAIIETGSMFSYTVPLNTFFDPDGDSLTYRATYNDGPLPSWLSFNADTRTFSGAPIGTNEWEIKVIAEDGKGGSISDTVLFRSNNVPLLIHSMVDPPIITTGNAFNYTVPSNTFFDPDGDSLTYRATYNDGPLPSWLTFNADTRTFSGTPTTTGDWEIKVYAEDTKGAKVSDTILIRSNNIPMVQQALTDPGTFTTNQLFSYTMPATTFFDPDGDTLTYTATYNGGDLPNWLSFNANTRTLSGTPQAVGEWRIDITATDTKGATVSDALNLRCKGLDPVLEAALNYRKNYVSETDWKDYFGCTETNYPGISDSINDILNSDCLFTPGKKVYETHLLYFFPSTCSGNDVTIRSQAALWSTNTGTMPYSDHAKLRVTSFSSQPDYEVQFQTADWSNRNADNHQWVLLYVGDPNIENGAIPGSRRKSWSDQQALFNSKNDGNYEIVKPIELVTGVMMKYIKTGEKIISDDPRTSLRTINEWTRYGHPEYRLVIGPFDNDGPYFAGNGKSDDYAGYINGVLYDDSLGIGICRKLN